MSSILDGKAEFGLCATKMCHNIGRQSCASLREAKRMGDKISVGKKISGGKTVFGLGRQNCVVALGGKTVLLYITLVWIEEKTLVPSNFFFLLKFLF